MASGGLVLLYHTAGLNGPTSGRIIKAITLSAAAEVETPQSKLMD